MTTAEKRAKAKKARDARARRLAAEDERNRAGSGRPAPKGGAEARLAKAVRKPQKVKAAPKSRAAGMTDVEKAAEGARVRRARARRIATQDAESRAETLPRKKFGTSQPARRAKRPAPKGGAEARMAKAVSGYPQEKATPKPRSKATPKTTKGRDSKGLSAKDRGFMKNFKSFFSGGHGITKQDLVDKRRRRARRKLPRG